MENNDRLNPLRDFLLNQSYEKYFLDFEKEHYGNSYLTVQSQSQEEHIFIEKWNSLDRIMVPAWHLSDNCDLGRRKCLTPVWSSYKVIRTLE